MLKLDHVTLRFGGLVANNDVSIHLTPGKIYALIGPNGAGKTTLFNTITGVYKPNEGKVVFCGQEIQGKAPYQINAAGIGRTYQVINLFQKMPVIDNVIVGMHTNLKANFIQSLFHLKKQKEEEQQAREKAMEWLRFAGLEDKAYERAGELSYGEQRRLEIVRALAGNPKLILLDEPAAGMNTKEKGDLDVLLKQILEMGVTVLMVEHDMKLVMHVADYIYVLNYGKLLAEGTPEQIQNNPEVIAAYLGGDE